MKFEVYGRTLEYDTAQENYNVIVVQMKEFQKKVRNEIVPKFYDTFSNMDEAMEGMWKFTEYFLMQPVEWALGFFSDNKIYNYDANRLIKRLADKGCNEPTMQAVLSIEEVYDSIIEDKEQAAAYRAARKEARGRWQGGGFGIEGAVKGAMTAGAANLATGAAHSAFNALGNMASSISASMKKDKMFKEVEMVEVLADGICQTMVYMSHQIAYILDEESDCPVKIPGNVEGEDHDAIMNNIRQGYITDEEQIKDMVIDVLRANPYHSGAYDLLFSKFWDKEGQLEVLADHFAYSKIKETKLEELRWALEDIDYYDLEALEKAEERVSEWGFMYGRDTLFIYEHIERVRGVLQKNALTVDGYKYESTEEAEACKKTILGWIDDIKATSGNDVVSMSAILSRVEESNVKSRDKYAKYLKSELEKEDKRSRTVKNVLYDSREAAAKARGDAGNVEALIKDMSSEEKIQAAREAANGMETSELSKMYSKYIDECESAWKAQQLEHYKSEKEKCSSRKELGLLFYEIIQIRDKARRLNCANKDFLAWVEEFKKEYCTVNGQLVSENDADKLYFKWIEHARQYLQYIQEKNNTKKTLFGSLKNAATGLVYKNYEGEYNSITDNGTKPIPTDNSEDLGSLNAAQTTAHSGFMKYSKELDAEYEKMKLSCDIEEVTLDVGNLFAQTEKVDINIIQNIMVACCPGLQINGGHKEESKNIEKKVPEQKALEKKETADSSKSDAVKTASAPSDVSAGTVGVRLVDCKDKKVAIIKVLREQIGCDMSKGKAIADATPTEIKVESESKANALFIALSAVGAKVEKL